MLYALCLVMLIVMLMLYAIAFFADKGLTEYIGKKEIIKENNVNKLIHFKLWQNVLCSSN